MTYTVSGGALNSAQPINLVTLYTTTMNDLLDHHCPVVMVRRRVRQATPLFDADCRAAQRAVRGAERRFRRVSSDVNKNELKKLRALYEVKKCKYWQSEIAESKGDMQRLWRSLNGVLGEVPNDDTSMHTPDDFATFFQNKVDSVCASTAATPAYDVPYRSTSTLSGWIAVTVG